MSSPSDFVEELKRRRVFRVAAMYGLAAWILLQVAEITFEPLGLPEASLRMLILVLALGFPVAVIGGFAFDLGANRNANGLAAAMRTRPGQGAVFSPEGGWLPETHSAVVAKTQLERPSIGLERKA